ncbi:hypothetical protein M7I_3443 [Glarea lozoyensis 74030]|uniref:Uncharacterized protein n=1 Tax=Glarea lozoyensis (strain ATCC 74030 / MF5533) TaxID=1104152 RepID=H0ELH9_GLAL7|nr:hypothetical protein M7I_3443 [Glarea lozoyensis 74030]
MSIISHSSLLASAQKAPPKPEPQPDDPIFDQSK